MGNINFHTKEILIKIVFYGPGMSGKTTTLANIHSTLPEEKRTAMVSLPTETDRTIHFDFLPVAMAQLRGFDVRLQLYTVPGQVYYASTREIVLREADGVVFVADSQKSRKSDNEASYKDLEENLVKQGTALGETPLVLQYNKQDLADTWEPHDLDRILNQQEAPSFGTVAATGEGVADVLDAISKLSVRHYVKKNQVAT